MKSSDLRKQMLQWRDDQPLSLKRKRDGKITENMIQCFEFNCAKRIFIYYSFRSEVSTKEIIEKALSLGKEIYIPKTFVDERCIRFYRLLSIEDTVFGYQGICEPKATTAEVRPTIDDLIVVPGSVFDRIGNRYGYGGGYYDRYFAKLDVNCARIGLCYQHQLVDELETFSTDVAMTHIITEQESLCF